MPGHHEGIVSREEYVCALLMADSNRKSRYFNLDYELMVIKEGLLSWFIPVNCAVGGYDASHYLGACATVEPAGVQRKVEIVHIEGAEVARSQELCGHSAAAATLSAKFFSFSKECTKMLPGVEYAEILLHPKERLLAVRKTGPGNRNAIPWQTGSVSSAAFMPVLFDLCGWHGNWKYRSPAVCFTRGIDRVLMFDLNETEIVIYTNVFDSNGNMIEKTSQTYMPQSWMDNFGDFVTAGFYSCRRYLAEALDNWFTNAPALSVSGFENRVALLGERQAKDAIQTLGA